MTLAWGAKVSAGFRDRVRIIADAVQCDPSHLMACMAFETGRTFSPSVRNVVSGATGLIQFMPGTAQALGTTTDRLAAMTAEEQLSYVCEYFRPYRGRLGSLSSVYMAILWPRAIGAAEGDVIFPAGSREYLQNRGLDIDHDNAVTKAEAAAFPAKLLAEGMNFASDEQPATPIEERGTPASPADRQRLNVGGADNSNSQSGGPVPFVPIMLSLLPSILNLFAPRAQAALTKVTGQPPDVVQQFAQSLFDKLGQLTGTSDPLQAAAAITKDPEANKVADLQEHALDYMDKLGPILDKLAGYDDRAWQAEESSRNAASARGLQAQESGPLWKNPTFLIAVFVLVLVAVVVCAVLFKGGFSTDMQAFTIGAIVGSALTAVLGFYFGSSRSSSAKDVLIGEMARRQPSQG